MQESDQGKYLLLNENPAQSPYEFDYSPVIRRSHEMSKVQKDELMMKIEITYAPT